MSAGFRPGASLPLRSTLGVAESALPSSRPGKYRKIPCRASAVKTEPTKLSLRKYRCPSNKKKKNASVPKDPDVSTLLKLHQAGMIEPYVLLNAADEGIAQDYAAYREKNRAKLEQYLSEFVVPPAPAK